MSNLIIGLLIYIFGFFLSLFILHKYGKQLEMANYDPPHEPYYDDYESNATAFASFSVLWPLFWLVFGVISFGKSIGRLSAAIGKKVNKDE